MRRVVAACTVPNRELGRELRIRGVGSGGPTVFVDHAAEHLSQSCGCADVDDDAWVVVGWVLVKALVWTVPVEVAFVLTQHCSGVLFVVDE